MGMGGQAGRMTTSHSLGHGHSMSPLLLPFSKNQCVCEAQAGMILERQFKNRQAGMAALSPLLM